MLARVSKVTECLKVIANKMFQGDPEWEDELDDFDPSDITGAINFRTSKKRYG